jgi:hypothetical protein
MAALIRTISCWMRPRRSRHSFTIAACSSAVGVTAGAGLADASEPDAAGEASLLGTLAVDPGLDMVPPSFPRRSSSV